MSFGNILLLGSIFTTMFLLTAEDSQAISRMKIFGKAPTGMSHLEVVVRYSSTPNTAFEEDSLCSKSVVTSIPITNGKYKADVEYAFRNPYYSGSTFPRCGFLAHVALRFSERAEGMYVRKTQIELQPFSHLKAKATSEERKEFAKSRRYVVSQNDVRKIYCSRSQSPGCRIADTKDEFNYYREVPYLLFGDKGDVSYNIDFEDATSVSPNITCYNKNPEGLRQQLQEMGALPPRNKQERTKYLLKKREIKIASYTPWEENSETLKYKFPWILVQRWLAPYGLEELEIGKCSPADLAAVPNPNDGLIISGNFGRDSLVYVPGKILNTK